MQIGIDLGGTKIAAIALDSSGRTIADHRVATPVGDYAGTIRAIARLVATIEAAHNETGTVGVGIPGAVSPHSGLVKNANSTWLIGSALAQDLQRELGRPVRIANDANCFALSEAIDGAGADAKVVFGVILGTGVGGGVVVAGHCLTGPDAIAGEWGHNPLPWPDPTETPGPACYCGQNGCIETYLSAPGLARDHETVAGTRLDARAIADLALSGNTAAGRSLSRYEDRLARGLATVINVLNPDCIVLGGGLSNINRLYDNVPRLWQRYIFSDQTTAQLRRPRHGDASGRRGAAWLWPARERT